VSDEARTYLKAVAQIQYVQQKWLAEKAHMGDKRRYTSTGILLWKCSHQHINTGHSIKYALGFGGTLQRHKNLGVRPNINSR